MLYCASARTDRQWPRNISLRSVNLAKKARADCSSSFQLWCTVYVVEGLLSCQVHNRGGPLLHQAQWGDTRLLEYFLIVLENGLSMDRFLVTWIIVLHLIKLHSRAMRELKKPVVLWNNVCSLIVMDTKYNIRPNNWNLFQDLKKNYLSWCIYVWKY